MDSSSSSSSLLTNEFKIDQFHEWISELCDPDSDIIQLANVRYFEGIQEIFEGENVKDQNVDDNVQDGLKVLLKYANKHNSYGEIIRTKGPFWIQPDNSEALLEGIINEN